MRGGGRTEEGDALSALLGVGDHQRRRAALGALAALLAAAVEDAQRATAAAGLRLVRVRVRVRVRVGLGLGFGFGLG